MGRGRIRREAKPRSKKGRVPGGTRAGKLPTTQSAYLKRVGGMTPFERFEFENYTIAALGTEMWSPYSQWRSKYRLPRR